MIAISAHRSPIGKTTVRFSQYDTEPVSACTRLEAAFSLSPMPPPEATVAFGRRAASSCSTPYQVSVMCRTVCRVIAAIASAQPYRNPAWVAP